MTTPFQTLKPFFEPRAVAVIGASRKPGTLGYMFLKTLQAFHFQGTIYVVHPGGDPILNLPTVPSVTELPHTPDLAIIMVRKERVAQVLTQCGEKGIPAVIIITAGFRETGDEGRRQEEQLVAIARQYGIRLMGPNCMGLFNTDPTIQLNASFSPVPPLTGNVSFISQSGALAVAVLETARQAGMGLAKMASVGNKADLTDLDFLAYLGADSHTRTIMIYQESLENPRQFLQLARQISPKKPIVVLKGGKSEGASRAAASHTGALATPAAVVEGLYQQAGIMSAQNVEDFIYSSLALSRWKRLPGRRIAVVTNAGGPGILTVDALEAEGLPVPPFSTQLQQQLAQVLPAEAAIGNPVDMIASATEQTYQTVTEILLRSQEVDGILIVIVRPPVNTTARDIAMALTSIVQSTEIPVGVVLLQAWNSPEAGIAEFAAAGIPVFPSPEIAARTLKQVVAFARRRSILIGSTKTQYPQLPEQFRSRFSPEVKNCQGFLSPDLALQLIETAGIPTAPWRVASSLEEAQHLLDVLHPPVVLKLISKTIIHKSDVGGVRLNIVTPQQVATAWQELSQIAGGQFKVLVQRQVFGKRELIIGANRDAIFGPTIMLGIGGIFVELFKQVAFRLLPLSHAEAEQFLEDFPGKQLLGNLRGMKAVDRKGLIQNLLSVSAIMEHFPQIQSLDINPLIISDDGQTIQAVDVRIACGEPFLEKQ